MKTRESKAIQNLKEMFRFAQHDKWNLWRCGIERTQTRIAHQVRLKSHLHFPSLAEGAGGGSLRASKASVATNRQGILMILALYTVDCFGYRLAMTRNSIHKNIYCHVERSETSLRFHAWIFLQGGQGA